MEQMKSSKEIADLLGVSQRRIQQLTSVGALTCERVNGKRTYNEGQAHLEYDAFLTEHQRGGKLIGHEFGDLEVIEADQTEGTPGRTRYTCRCKCCGRILHMRPYELANGKKERCAYCERKRRTASGDQ